MDLYQKKYLKYKAKYQLLKSQYGGNKRLMKDIRELNFNPVQGISLEPTDNLFIQYATITGPPDTPYEGYIWRVKLKFPQDYSYIPPTAHFMDRMYHPNVDYNIGDVCIEILLINSWNHSFNISSILLLLQSLLYDTT